MPVIKPRPIVLTPEDEAMLRDYARWLGESGNYILHECLGLIRDNKDFIAWQKRQGTPDVSPHHSLSRIAG